MLEQEDEAKSLKEAVEILVDHLAELHKLEPLYRDEVLAEDYAGGSD